MIVDAILMLAAAALLELIGPWWTLGIASFVVAAIRSGSGKDATMAGLIAGLLLWLGVSLFIHLGSGGVLTVRIAEMMQLPAFVVIVLTGILGGVVASVSAFSGFQVGVLIKRGESSGARRFGIF